MPSYLPIDQRRYHRLRWRARAVTVIGAGAVLYWLPPFIGALRSGDPFGALYLLFLVITAAPTAWFVGRAWRTSYAARPHPIGADESHGAAVGVPELDTLPGRHASLSGEIEPPRRW